MVKAAVMWSFNEPLKIDSIQLKDPRADEVVVKVVASGVCHSDLSVVKMVLPIPPPCVLGHEGAGIVEEVGSAVKDLKPGDHVVLSWVENCGKCHYCTSGNDHLCDTGIRSSMSGQEGVFEKDGVDISRMAGVASFAERTVVRATACVKIDESVPLDRACLVGCGVMTGVGAAVNTAQVRPGETVAVFGCGGVGLNVIQGAALCGASRIIAVDLVDSKLELARQLGADVLVNPTREDPVAAIKKHGGADQAICVAVSPKAFEQAYRSLRRGGTLVFVALPADNTMQLPIFETVLNGIHVVGSIVGTRVDLAECLELHARKRTRVVYETRKLEDVNRCFEEVAQAKVPARLVFTF